MKTDGALGSLEGRLRAGRESDDWIASARVPALEVALFTRQLAVLLQAGVPILKALGSLAEQTENPTLAEVVWTIRDTISAGNSLSKALSPFLRIFPRLYITMLRVGEQSGALVLCLDRLAAWLERDARLVSRVKAGLSYPVFVFVLGLVITGMLFIFVLPPFLEMLQGMGAPLLWSTRLLWTATKALHSPPAWLVAAGIALGVYYWGGQFLATARGRRLLWTTLTRIPVLGPALNSYSLARVAAAGSVLLESGCDTSTTWTLALEAGGDPRLAADSAGLIRHLMNGGDVATYFSLRPDLYPPVLAHLLTAGQEVGQMEAMMDNLRVFYDQDVDVRLEAVTTLLQPLMLSCVSGMLIFSMVSIFVPLYSFLDVL